MQHRNPSETTSNNFDYIIDELTELIDTVNLNAIDTPACQATLKFMSETTKLRATSTENSGQLPVSCLKLKQLILQKLANGNCSEFIRIALQEGVQFYEPFFLFENDILYNSICLGSEDCALLLMGLSEFKPTMESSLFYGIALGSAFQNDKIDFVLSCLSRLKELGYYTENAADGLLKSSIIQNKSPALLRWLVDNSSEQYLQRNHLQTALRKTYAEAVKLDETVAYGCISGLMEIADILLSPKIGLKALPVSNRWTLKRAIAAGHFYLAAGMWNICHPVTEDQVCDWVRISQKPQGLSFLRDLRVSEDVVRQVEERMVAEKSKNVGSRPIAESNAPTRYGGGFRQTEYRMWFRQCTDEAVNIIRRSTDFWQLSHYLAQARSEVAFRLEHFPPEHYGRWRGDPESDNFYGISTPFVPNYEEAAHRASLAAYDTCANLNYYYLDPDSGEQIPLGTIEVDAEAARRRDSICAVTLIHTHEEYLVRLQPMVQALFEQACAPRQPGMSDDDYINAVCKTVARWHWLFAQMTPYQRGSAAIGEIIISALMEFHGIDYGESTVKEGRDTYALTNTTEGYAAEFLSTFKYLKLKCVGPIK